MTTTILLLITLLVISPLATAYTNNQDELPIYVRPKVSGQLTPDTTYPYDFVFTNQANCQSPLLNVSTTIHTDHYGIGYTSLNISSLTTPPTYMCEYRNGALRAIHQLNKNIFDPDTLDSLTCNINQTPVFDGSQWACQNTFNPSTITHPVTSANGYTYVTNESQDFIIGGHNDSGIFDFDISKGRLKIDSTGDHSSALNILGYNQSTTSSTVIIKGGFLPTSLNDGKALQVKYDGEALPRLTWYYDGSVTMGGGSTTPDVILDRPTTSTLRLSSDKANGAADLIVNGQVQAGVPGNDQQSLNVIGGDGSWPDGIIANFETTGGNLSVNFDYIGEDASLVYTKPNGVQKQLIGGFDNNDEIAIADSSAIVNTNNYHWAIGGISPDPNDMFVVGGNLSVTPTHDICIQGGNCLSNFTFSDADNGLGIVSNKVGLGGDLVRDTNISVNNHDLFIKGPGNTVITNQAVDNYVAVHDNSVSLYNNNWELNLQNGGAIINDLAHQKGITYANDYSANYDNRTLVDKEYVDTHVSPSKWRNNPSHSNWLEPEPAKDIIYVGPRDYLNQPIADVGVALDGDGYSQLFETKSTDMIEGLLNHNNGQGDSGVVSTNFFASGLGTGFEDNSLYLFTDKPSTSLRFRVNNSEVARIDKYGHLKIGDLNTNDQPNDPLVAIGPGGYEQAVFSVSGRTDYPGIANFRDKDGESIFVTRGSLANNDLEVHFGDEADAYGSPALLLDDATDNFLVRYANLNVTTTDSTVATFSTTDLGLPLSLSVVDDYLGNDISLIGNSYNNPETHIIGLDDRGLVNVGSYSLNVNTSSQRVGVATSPNGVDSLSVGGAVARDGFFEGYPSVSQSHSSTANLLHSIGDNSLVSDANYYSVPNSTTVTILHKGLYSYDYCVGFVSSVNDRVSYEGSLVHSGTVIHHTTSYDYSRRNDYARYASVCSSGLILVPNDNYDVNLRTRIIRGTGNFGETANVNSVIEGTWLTLERVSD